MPEHALTVAHADLTAVLRRASEEREAGGHACSNPNDLCREIERFINILFKIEGGEVELRGRATLVNSHCREWGKYTSAVTQAVSVDKKTPRHLAKAIGSLLQFTDAPLRAAEIDWQRSKIEQILGAADELKLSDAARQAFERWLSACAEVQRHADGLEVDGCWYLFYVHQAGCEIADRPGLERKTMA